LRASVEISASKQGRVVRLKRTDPVGSETLHPNEENNNRLNTNFFQRNSIKINIFMEVIALSLSLL
jgi:hypothetical protein